MPARPDARTHAHAPRHSGSPEPMKCSGGTTARAVSACGTWCKVLCGVIVLGVFTVAHWHSLQEPVAGPLAGDAEALGVMFDADDLESARIPGALNMLDYAPSVVLAGPLTDAVARTAGAGDGRSSSVACWGPWAARITVRSSGAGVRTWPLLLTFNGEPRGLLPGEVFGEVTRRVGQALLW